MTGLVAHLEAQVASARRVLRVVLAQREAIRRQDVETVLIQLGEIQSELATRRQLELERDAILGEAARTLGLVPETVDLDCLLALVPETEAQAARAKSAELRGLFNEIALVHGQNRVLIRQELSFLDHLLRVLSGTPQSGYSPLGDTTPVSPLVSVVDAKA